MDIDTLQAFVAVAESGSFSHASEQLFLTQPAISKRIAALEDELETLLFDRIGRRITLTEAGKALLPRARNILLAIDDSRRAIRNLSTEVTGTLRIGTSHHIGLHRLPPVLRSFSRAYPEVELDIHFMDSEQACQAVEHGDLELGIVTLPSEPGTVLRTAIIWPDPLCVVIGKHHALARARQVTLKALADHNAILPAKGTFTRDIIERTLAPRGIQLKISLATNYLETIKMLVSVGLGWSVLPESMLSKDLKALPIRGLQMRRELGIVWHSGRTLSNAAEAMQEQLMQAKEGR